MPKASSDKPNVTTHHEIPADFPRPEIASALAGSQPKFSMVQFEGKYYLPGGTPPERLDNWQQCEQHARDLSERCITNKLGKYSDMSEVEILEMYCQRLLNANSGFSPEEDKWKIRRVAALLGWAVPRGALPQMDA